VFLQQKFAKIKNKNKIVKGDKVKKVIMIAVMLGGLVSGAWAERVLLIDFYRSAEYISPYLKKDATKYNHSCGPTSTVFIYNYYLYKNSNGKKVLFLGNLNREINRAKWTIRHLYTYIGQKNNTDMRTFDPLIRIGAGKYDFQNVEQRSMWNSLNTNLTYMFNDLKNGIPAIVSLSGQYNGEGRYKYRYHSTNPVGRWNHIVIIYGYDKKNNSYFSNSDIVYYFDPYFGKFHYMTLKELKRVANQDNMDYLRFGKWYIMRTF